MSKYEIGAMPPALPEAIIEKLRNVETATVGHVRHWGFMDRRIQCLLPGKRVVGNAVTLALPGQDSTLLHHALTLVRPGDFLVIDRLGDFKHACWGGTVTAAAHAAGLVGCAIDGACTDPSEIREFDFPVWSRGVSPITTRLYNNGGAMNQAVSCGGVSVSPGDVVLADDNGVLILHRHEVEQVADAALAKQQRGVENCRRLAAGEKLGDITGASRMVLES